MMFALERATSNRRVTLWTILGLILVPLVVAGGFLWATWGSTDRLGRVQAAIVNNDDPVTINKQLVPLGRQLAGGLVSDTDDPNFSWLLTDDADAADGLAAGRYAAVVTIPKDFSKNATSFSKTDADQIKQARIDVQTSQISGIADPVVGQAITAQATKVVNTTLTKQYLNNIYVGFNTMGKQFGTLASAAGKLSDGTTKLTGGITKTATGTGALADGIGQLDDGTAQLASGLDQYATGVGKYADGVGQFANGVGKLADGTKQSAAGAGKLATAGKKKLAPGAQQLADGADGVLGGLNLLRQGGKTPQVVVPGTKQTAADAVDVATRVGTVAGTLGAQAQLSDDALGQTPLACPDQIPADSCAIYYAGVKAASGAAAQQLAGPATAAGDLAKSASIDDAVLAGTIGTASTKKADATGVHLFAEGLQSYADGVGSYVGGVGQLAGGLGKLSAGTAKLATGANKLADGADQLSTGADQLSSGLTAVSGGLHQTTTGTFKLADGLNKLSDGGQQLADGTAKFADGLDKGKDAVPSYDKAQRKALSTVVATPVTTPKVDTVFSNIATTTFLAVIALWLGAQASSLVLGAISRRVVSSMKPSWRLALEGLAPAALISVLHASLLTFVLQRLLHLDAGDVGRLLPFTLLAGLAFVAVNHALVSWFGGIGRFISVILVVVSAAGAITSAVPELFASISPYLPLTPALEGIRAIVSGGSGAGGHTGALLAWLIVGVSTSVVAVARKRMMPALVAVPA